MGTFLHAVTPEEEEEMKDDRLCKLLPLIKYLRGRCLDLYQPVMELSVDERMVKSRARCHMIQYMKNKPTKFGFKLRVVADPSGYTRLILIFIQAKVMTEVTKVSPIML